MVKIISEGFDPQNASMTLQYNKDDTKDIKIIDYLRELLMQQPNCQKCKNYYLDYGFGGSFSSQCKITSMENGNLAYFGHPHHDFDASKCEYYERR